MPDTSWAAVSFKREFVTDGLPTAAVSAQPCLHNPLNAILGAATRTTTVHMLTATCCAHTVWLSLQRPKTAAGAAAAGTAAAADAGEARARTAGRASHPSQWTAAQLKPALTDEQQRWRSNLAAYLGRSVDVPLLAPGAPVLDLKDLFIQVGLTHPSITTSYTPQLPWFPACAAHASFACLCKLRLHTL